MLVRSCHGIDLGPEIPEDFSLLLRSHSMGNIYPLLNSSTLINLLDPLLHSGELRQVNLQGNRSTTNPRETRNIGNSILLTRQVRAFLQPRLENRVETPRLVDIPLNSVIRARIGEQTEMVRLSCLVLERDQITRMRWIICTYLAWARVQPSGTLTTMFVRRARECQERN